jgi:hypothetical protein
VADAGTSAPDMGGAVAAVTGCSAGGMGAGPQPIPWTTALPMLALLFLRLTPSRRHSRRRAARSAGFATR